MHASGTDNRTMRNDARRAHGLIGLLITMAIIAVLFALLMSSMNRAVTGEGSAVEGTVRSIEDQAQLMAIHQAFAIHALGDPRNRGGRFLVPSVVSRTDDRSLDTTADLYSAMIALNFLRPETLISPNEYSTWVEADTDYDFRAYQPAEGRFWDTDFKADLQDVSNVSYAHMPLYGRRFEKHWSGESRNLVLGNRGPKDGIDDPASYTYGRNKQWAGHIVFGDGSIDFITTFTPGNVQVMPPGAGGGGEGGESASTADNIFRFDDGVDGVDAILGFTKKMTANGPELVWD